MTVEDQSTKLRLSAEPMSLYQHLQNEWNKALTGDKSAQSEWKSETGGDWLWNNDSVQVRSTGTEWSNLAWHIFDKQTTNSLKNFVIEVSLSGKAEAAGLSFGDFKDFLVHLDSDTNARRLQLEIDLHAGCWAFRVDGQLQSRSWWDSEIHGVQDFLNGILRFKTRRVKNVRFYDLAIHTFQSSCQLSVIMCCFRFRQRLQVALRNWCHQNLSHGNYELLIVNPNSPDGTHEYLAAVASSYPHVRVREVPVETKLATNKAAMINRAFQASRGEWIWLTDADCLFSPMAAEKALAQVKGKTSNLFYGQRRFLTSSQTSELLAGRMDGLNDFETLCLNIGPRAPDNEPWGYTQIVSRSTLERSPYREQVNHFAHSDSLFIQDCKRLRILPVPVEGLFCLHLDHPFAWYGTNAFL